jgi:hypothetical protein
MSTTTKTGNQVFLWLKPAGSGIYKKLVCNTTLEVTRSAALIESETKCETLRAAGSITNEVPAEFVVKFNPDSDELSFATLHGYFTGKSSLDILVADDETSPIIYSESATGVITEFNTTLNTNEFVAGTLTLSISGATTISIPV